MAKSTNAPIQLERLEREHDNLRAALAWSLEQAGEGGTRGDERGREIALRLGGALRGFWRVHGQISEGRNFLERALAVREGSEAFMQAKALIATATLAYVQGEYERAESLCKESLALYRELEDLTGVAHSLHELGLVSSTRGDIATARSLLAESLAIARAVDDEQLVAWALFHAGQVESSQGEYARARTLFEESLAFAAAWSQGRAMTPQQALEARGHKPPSSSPVTDPPPSYPAGLTARRVEVLRLLASGLTDQQIAEKLVLSPRTVHAHINSIYNKLDVSSRSAATRYALEHRLT